MWGGGGEERERERERERKNKERVCKIKTREGAKIFFYSPTYNQCSRKTPIISQMWMCIE